MAATPDQLTDAQKEAVYTLKKEGKSGRTVSDLAAQGVLGLPPFTVSHQHANTLFRRMERQRDALTTTDLAKKGAAHAIPILIERMISTAERQIEGHARDQAAGKLDARDFKATAGTLRELKALADKIPSGQGNAGGRSSGKKTPESEPPNGFISGLLAAESEEPEAMPPPIGDVRVPARSHHKGGSTKAAPDPPLPEVQTPQPTSGEASIEDRIRMAAAAHRQAVASGADAVDVDASPLPGTDGVTTTTAGQPHSHTHGGQTTRGPVPTSDRQPELPDVVRRALSQG